MSTLLNVKSLAERINMVYRPQYILCSELLAAKHTIKPLKFKRHFKANPQTIHKL